MNLSPEQWITSAIFGVALLLIATMVFLEKRNRADFKVSLVPTTPILLLSGLVAMLALVHLLNLAGVHTGR
jgi:hypothetical protein